MVLFGMRGHSMGVREPGLSPVLAPVTPNQGHVLLRAVSWFADRGVTVERVHSDNGSAYNFHLWRDTCAGLEITVKKTRPYRPQTNGEIERFHRTFANEWAFSRFSATESSRRNALRAWLDEYNHHRLHTGIGGESPIERVHNVPGKNS